MRPYIFWLQINLFRLAKLVPNANILVKNELFSTIYEAYYVCMQRGQLKHPVFQF